MHRLATRGAVFTLACLLAACNMPKLDNVIKDKQAEYKSSKSLPPLEVPPDLASANIDEAMAIPDTAAPEGSATYSEYIGERQAAGAGTTVAAAGTTPVLLTPDGVRVAKDGDKRWLVLDGPPSNYWNRVRQFWVENGFNINIENPSIGIIETDWAENRADVPQGWLRKQLGGLLDAVYSAATRDKFRIRFERGTEPKTTELYLSHRGVEEIVQANDTAMWKPREADPELEAEMLNRLMVHLGVKEEKAQRMMAAREKRPPKAQMMRDSEGNVSLSLKEEYSRAWRRTGLALDRVGFTVEDRDRSRGLYFVRYVDPLEDTEKKDGLMSKLKFWGDNEKKPAKMEYLISLIGEGKSTELVILDKQGKLDNGRTAGRILNLLYEQLN